MLVGKYNNMILCESAFVIGNLSSNNANLKLQRRGAMLLKQKKLLKLTKF